MDDASTMNAASRTITGLVVVNVYKSFPNSNRIHANVIGMCSRSSLIVSVTNRYRKTSLMMLAAERPLIKTEDAIWLTFPTALCVLYSTIWTATSLGANKVSAVSHLADKRVKASRWPIGEFHKLGTYQRAHRTYHE